ncbi:alpha/beta hydrolase [Kordiimonas aestuarii]|uniref:alpha/beta hydrolase n=1 Tax=Kordiimonas aestuarii TaxID=1005925 RepID=UPI0021D03420|nr:alpha/beta hydrolase [Kordiimonas aestuarii]
MAAFAYSFQEHLMFHFAPVPDNYEYKFHGAYDNVTIENDDGHLHGVLFKSELINTAGPRPRNLVIYYKGNAGNVGDSERLAKLFLGLGYDVLSMDYRGFGKSRGPLSEEKLLDDAEKWFDWGAQRYGTQNIRVVGYSFGTTFASHVAAAKAVSNVMLFAPMRSIVDMATRRYPFLPEFLTNYPLRSDEKLKNAAGHVVIYHGTADEVVPYASGAGLQDVLGADDLFVPVEGADHYNVALRPEVQADIISRWSLRTAVRAQMSQRAVAGLSGETAR